MAPLLLLLMCTAAWCGEVLSEREDILDYQPILHRQIVKRQAQYGSEQQQYIQQGQASQQLPPEYLSLLQQVEAQQGIGPAHPGLIAQQPDVQQLLGTRAPQRFIGQPPRPLRPRLSPQAEEQRRLQEAVSQKNIREQEVRDEQRQQQAQYQQYYQQQGIDPQYLRQLQQYEAAQQQQIQAAQQQQAQAAQQQQAQAAQQQQLQATQQQSHPQQYAQQQYVQVPEQQYVQAPSQAEYVQVPTQQQYVQAQQAIPERVSYSQVRFGTTKLTPQRLVPQQSQRPVYTQRSQPQDVAYVQPQQVVAQQPQQIVYRQPEQVVYTQQSESYQPQIQKSVEHKQHPEQYLIETTKPEPPQEQVVAIPRQRAQPIYYRPQPNYDEIQASILAQQQQQHYAQQQAEGATTPAPSRSSIFVSTSRTPIELKPSYAKQRIEEVRLPKQEGRRPLTQGELNALINAGFKVTPSPDPGQEYEQSSYDLPQQTNYYRGIGKRQNKAIPRPVPLTEQERQHLARQGITNLYRVETAESQNAPPTYVLAIGGPTSKKQK